MLTQFISGRECHGGMASAPNHTGSNSNHKPKIRMRKSRLSGSARGGAGNCLCILNEDTSNYSSFKQSVLSFLGIGLLVFRGDDVFKFNSSNLQFEPLSQKKWSCLVGGGHHIAFLGFGRILRYSEEKSEICNIK